MSTAQFISYLSENIKIESNILSSLFHTYGMKEILVAEVKEVKKK